MSTLRTAVLLLALPAAACRSAPPDPIVRPAAPGVEFRYSSTAEDGAELARVRALVEAERGSVAEFFGAPFAEPVHVEVLPDRAAFTAWFPPEWGMGETACWMVAVGVDRRLALLSPRVWERDACEHDPSDRDHLRDLVVHELVHVYHGQRNPSRDFVGAEGIAWFLEGLATYASGQLERGHRERAREAVATGAAPTELEAAWSGPFRYGVAGTLVEFLDLAFGREVLVAMLELTTEEELLALVGLTEEQLLVAWRAHVEALPAR